jgi:hypothetical protein
MGTLTQFAGDRFYAERGQPAARLLRVAADP